VPFFRMSIIRGCDDSTPGGTTPYLTRFRIVDLKSWGIYLHIFHRSDVGPELHDHPFGFLSVILWRGYIEVTPRYKDASYSTYAWATNRRRIHPLTAIWRPAEWRHRVDLIDGKRAVTLVFRGPRVREWGFWTSKGWQHFKDFFREHKC
jgi:hypothetical protein